MTTDLRKMRKDDRKLAKELRKDRLIQTRVDRRLQAVLSEEARRRRMSVSNLVRAVLEDAFGLADPDVGPVVEGIEESVRPLPELDHVYAWNQVVLGKDALCSRCTQPVKAGERAFIGLSEDPTADRAWLCAECGEDL